MILLYTILVKEPDHYIPMFRLMWESLDLFGDVKCDFLIIGNNECLGLIHHVIKKPKCVRKLHALEVPTEGDLHDALLRKLDVAEFSLVKKFAQIMYIDCDIIVRSSLKPIFDSMSQLPNNILHAVKEDEDFNHPFFGFERYTLTEKKAMRRRGLTTFNDGTLIFVPTDAILDDFRAIKTFAADNPDLRKRYYDQSFVNNYFNSQTSNTKVSTKLLSPYIVIFPKDGKMYTNKALVHFTGLGNYANKAGRMATYLTKLRRSSPTRPSWWKRW